MQATRVLLEIILADYYTCVARLPLNSPEYRMLQNGVRARNPAEEEVVHVLCEQETAKKIREMFGIYCPEALQRIKELPADF